MAGERDLDERAGLQQLVEVHGIGGEHRGDAVAHAARDPLLGGGGDEDAAAGPLRRANEMRAREQAQRLAEGGAADAEGAGEVLLTPEPIAGLQALALHVRSDVGSDLLAGAAPPVALASVGVGRHATHPTATAIDQTLRFGRNRYGTLGRSNDPISSPDS